MSTSQLILETPDGPMSGFRADPEGAPRGAIVVIQEAFGVNRHIESVAERLADSGWVAIAPALFHRQGSPVLGYDDLASVMPVMGQLTIEGIGDDLSAAFDYLEAEGYPSASQGIVGFCMGGTVTFVGATLRPLGAAVTYYGGGLAQGRFGGPSLIELAGQLQTPWLGHFGDLDKGIPVEEVEQLRAALAQASVPAEIERYGDADHGFNCDGRPAVYHADAAAAAWTRTLTWFDDHIKHP
jgi:carboxymethylenebutenolidase